MNGMQPGGEGPRDPTARADWASSADGGGGVAAPPAASPNMPDAEHAPGAAPQVSEQQQQPQTVPVAVTPLKRGGLLGVMDSIGDALVGRTRPELGKDPDGNMYIKDVTLSHGAQWRRIAGEAMAGAAAGLAAGRGAGNTGKAAVAGIQAGQQIQDRDQQNINDQINQDDKIMLSNANRQMLRMNFAEKAWEAARKGVKATQEDIEFNQKQEDRYVAQGGKILGRVADPSQIGEVLKVNPDLAQDLVKRHLIELTQHINPDGTAGGFSVIKMPDKYRDQFLPSGATFHTFNETTGQIEEHHSSDPMTVGDRDDYDTAAGLAQMKWRTAKADQDAKAAQAQKDLGDATKVPSEIEVNQTKSALNRAEAGKVPSEIDKNNAAANKDKLGSGQGPEGEALVDSIGTGRVTADRLGYLIARNPQLLEAVVKKYPDFDTSKAGSYPALYKDFTSGKTAKQLNSGSTALLHLKELDQLNTVMSHIPGTPAYNRYQNKADTVAHELAQFYGNTTIPAIEGIKKTIASQAPGTRDAAIREQARSMGDKFNEFEATWKRGVPSAAYMPLMPQLSDASKEARAYLDPDYKQQLIDEQKAEQQRQQQQAPPPKGPVIGQQDAAIPQPLAPARPNAAPQSAAFSKSVWLKANPGGDINAAVQAAQAAGHPVID